MGNMRCLFGDYVLVIEYIKLLTMVKLVIPKIHILNRFTKYLSKKMC